MAHMESRTTYSDKCSTFRGRPHSFSIFLLSLPDVDLDCRTADVASIHRCHGCCCLLRTREASDTLSCSLSAEELDPFRAGWFEVFIHFLEVRSFGQASQPCLLLRWELAIAALLSFAFESTLACETRHPYTFALTKRWHCCSNFASSFSF